MRLLCEQNFLPLNLKHLNTYYDKFEPPKISTKSMTEIKSYAANTHQGIIR